MAEFPDYFPAGADPAAVRDEWVAAVEALVSEVEGWCRGTDWATRRADKRVEDPPLEPYHAPMLLMQNWDLRVLLEPITRFGYGDDGSLELYEMPAYDDVAKVFRRDGGWQVREVFRNGTGDVPFTRDAFARIMDEFRTRHAKAG